MRHTGFTPKDYKDVRSGAGVKWKHETVHGTIEGYMIDHLNTKTLSEAESRYEKVFILIREALEANDACCMDDETDRLKICQEVADSLRSNSLIAK